VNDLTVEDFKNLLLDLYLVQRDRAELQRKLEELQKENRSLREPVDEEA
jgi:cell division protein FtsB